MFYLLSMANTNHRGTPRVDLLSAVSVLAGAQASETNSDPLDRALIGQPYLVGEPDLAGRRYFQLGGVLSFPVYEAAGVVTPANPDDHLEEPAARAFAAWLAAYDAEGAALAAYARDTAGCDSAPAPRAVAALGLGECACGNDLRRECRLPSCADGARNTADVAQCLPARDARGERAA